MHNQNLETLTDVNKFFIAKSYNDLAYDLCLLNPV